MELREYKKNLEKAMHGMGIVDSAEVLGDEHCRDIVAFFGVLIGCLALLGGEIDVARISKELVFLASVSALSLSKRNMASWNLLMNPDAHNIEGIDDWTFYYHNRSPYKKSFLKVLEARAFAATLVLHIIKDPDKFYDKMNANLQSFLKGGVNELPEICRPLSKLRLLQGCCFVHISWIGGSIEVESLTLEEIVFLLQQELKWLTNCLEEVEVEQLPLVDKISSDNSICIFGLGAFEGLMTIKYLQLSWSVITGWVQTNYHWSYPFSKFLKSTSNLEDKVCFKGGWNVAIGLVSWFSF